jgi:hypothetical protein
MQFEWNVIIYALNIKIVMKNQTVRTTITLPAELLDATDKAAGYTYAF